MCYMLEELGAFAFVKYKVHIGTSLRPLSRDPCVSVIELCILGAKISVYLCAHILLGTSFLCALILIYS